jgi:C4-dicarboxylate-specific signal transduction histidine kinase
VFADADGELQMHNAAFAAEFPGLASHLTRTAFVQQFEDVSGLHAGGEEIEALHTESRRSYALRSTRFAADCAAELLTATNVSARNETLRRHKSQAERLLFTSRVMSVGEMTTTLAHELNQPLAAIMNYLNVALRLIRGQSPELARSSEALLLAREQAAHASAVITRLREFVRAREPKRSALAVADLVATVMQLLKLEAEKQRVRVVTELPASLPSVFADRVMLEQVLLNLVKNAIEAMRDSDPKQREIRIVGRINLDEQIELRVSDLGCGLSAAEAQQLFTPFYTTKSDGLGVGLAICRSIIEYHEGRLYFENNPKGGSVFVVTLPQASAERIA